MMKNTLIRTAAALCLAAALATGFGAFACADVTLFENGDENIRKVTLTGDGASFDCGGIAVRGNEVTVTAPGEYAFTGTLTNGCIVVNTGASAEKVEINLNGVTVTNPAGPAIRVDQADKVKLKIVKDTENVLTSGAKEMLDTFSDTDESRKAACIFSEDDLEIKGGGTLRVYGYINNGITGKDDVEIENGSIFIVAANNGIKGSESIEIRGGSINVECGNDALKTTSGKKAGKGYVRIEDGELTLIAGGNGISAVTDLTITGGHVTISSEKKELKAENSISVKEGTLTKK